MFAGVAVVGTLYTVAGVFDKFGPQPRDGGQYGKNRTTKIEDLLKSIGALVLLVAIILAFLHVF